LSFFNTNLEREAMDRREALKKIGAGGAVAVGATAVLSSPAFAYTLPTVGANPTITLTATTTTSLTIAISGYPAGSCPASSTNAGDVPTQGTVSISWELKRQLADGTFTVPGDTNAISPIPRTGTGTTVTRGSGQWDGQDSTAGHDHLIVRVRRSYTCTYGTGSATRCVEWQFEQRANPTFGTSVTWAAATITRNESATGCA